MYKAELIRRDETFRYFDAEGNELIQPTSEQKLLHSIFGKVDHSVKETVVIEWKVKRLKDLEPLFDSFMESNKLDYSIHSVKYKKL